MVQVVKGNQWMMKNDRNLQRQRYIYIYKINKYIYKIILDI